MNPEIFAEWLHRQGHHIFRTSSSYWFDARPRVLQAFPYHWLIQPPAKELRDLTLGKGNIALRYSTPFSALAGKASYHVVLTSPYTMEHIRPKARNCVRRGVERCHVERINFDRMAKEGWVLQQDTLERQGRLRSMAQTDWERICRSAQDLPGFEVWASVVDGELAATLLVAQIDDTCCVPYAQSHRNYLGLHVNNALFYTVSCDLLQRDAVKAIFFGLHSLDAPESVDEFKFRMGLMVKPVRQVVAFHPLFQPMANQYVHKMLARILIRDPSNSLVAKAEGMLRFHLEGKLPLSEQDWPDCLLGYKEKVLGNLQGEGPGRESTTRIQMNA
jgi:hypothetical protein